MKKTNYQVLKVANVIISIAIAFIALSTMVGIILSLTHPHMDLTNQSGNGLVLDVNIPEKLLHSTSFLSLFAMNSILWIALLVFVKMFFKNIIDNNIFTPENVRLARYVVYNFISLAFLDSWFQSLCSGSGVLSFVNWAYLVAAFIVWVFSMILKEANIIAEENEFTV
ncbi:DUF2975 domain-containing protein [Streptococcus equinus]|uniref:DUF2975 domain-containing protein n=1 Tax=Streptococcus equinus TaxID=1335 RepID=UPI0008B22953|nr:DUF2975 domain-containing protein [Streptococcus equinus]SEK86015.1 Protein of unknown function [Streptococcus equinus]